ncbi:HEAT repeat domain-containing protein [Candidatus Bathyarchaeota archaeon]|nr:HEAT repeat domain-containing protein [Candidatus Bathyarchaeota archaeon]
MKEKKNIEGLIKALKHENNNVRGNATNALGEVGDSRAVEPLIQILKNDYGNSQEACLALGKIRNRNIVEPFVQILGNKNKWAFLSDVDLCNIIKLFDNIRDPEAYKRIFQKLSFKDVSGYGFILRVGILALKVVKSEEAVEFLIQELSDDNISVQETAKKCLEELGVNEFLELLMNLKGETIYFQKEASSLLLSVSIRERREAELFIKALMSEKIGLRIIALQVLNRNWNKIEEIVIDKKYEIVEYLLTNLRNKQLEPYVAILLGTIGDRIDVGPLIETFQTLRNTSVLDDQKNMFAKILANIGDKRAAEVIINYLFEDSWGISFPVDSLFEESQVEQDRHGFYESIRKHTFLSDFSKNPLTKLFEDYTELILKTAFYEYTERECTSYKQYSYSLDESTAAVVKLSQINTRISTNILRKVVNRSDHNLPQEIVYSDNYNQGIDTDTVLSFENQREMARLELSRRGNPSYDPFAYLDEKGWKLTKH